MASDKVLRIGNDVYETLPDVVTYSSRWLVEMWERVGRPDSPLTDSGEKMMRVIIAVWEELYPKEAKKWYEERKNYQNSELPITEQIHKRTGRSLASYPYQVFMMMKVIFPNFKPGKRENCIKLVKKFPMLRMANRI
jgi:hypothetical protein